MWVDISDYLSADMALPAANSIAAKDLRKLISEKFPFLEYAVRSLLFHADSASSHGISQEDFVEEFAISDWIMLYNLVEKHQVRRHTPNTSLLHICAEKSFSNLVRIQLERESYSATATEYFETRRYTAPL